MVMLKCKREEYESHSFKLAGGLFCNCGIPYTRRFRNLPCYHIFCQTCINRDDHQNKCQRCDSLIDKTEELHPNEELFICTVPKCNQGFFNFLSLMVHAKLSHSVNVESPEEFYEKFGDSDILLSQNKLLNLESYEYNNISVIRNQDKCISNDAKTVDQNSTKFNKSNKKDCKSNGKDEELEILM